MPEPEPSWPLDPNSDRGRLIQAIVARLKNQNIVTLGGEPGVGMRWIARRVRAAIPELRVSSAPQADTTAAQLALGGMHPDLLVHPLAPDAGVALIRRAWQAEPFRVYPVPDDAHLLRLATACEGRPAGLVAAARRAARVGIDAVEPEVLESVSLSGIPPELQVSLASLCIPRTGFTRSEAEAALGRGIHPTLDALVRIGWLRRSTTGLFRCARAIATACRRDHPDACEAAEVAWARWGTTLAEVAVWAGRAAARRVLCRHAPMFRHLAQRPLHHPVTPSALLAWAAGSRYEPAMDRTLSACADAVACLPSGTDRARIALILAELARLRGPAHLVPAALAIAQDEQPWRARIIAGRAAFNRGEFERAMRTADQTYTEATAHGDEAAAAQARLLAASVARAAAPPEVARQKNRMAQAAFRQMGGTAGMADARGTLALLELELGHAAAGLDEARSAAELAWGIRRGNTLSICCMAHELNHAHAAALVAIDQALACKPTGLFHAIWLTYRARVLLALGDASAARIDADAAVQGFTAARADTSLSTVRCLQALCACDAADLEAAQAHLQTARTIAPADQRDRHQIIELTHATMARLMADRARPGVLNQPDQSAWEQLIHRTALPVGAPASIHLRTFHALITAIGAQVETRAAAHNTLHLDSTTRCFTTRERTVDLSHRAVLWRLLSTLFERPDLDDATLFEAVWQGERVRASSAQNRLRVAITEIRTLSGMRDLIRRVDGRYSLGIKPGV